MKFGLMYDFRNPEPWRRPFPELYRATLDQIARVDELGYDNVWLTEHHFVDDGYNPSVLTAAAAIAARTSRIRIGSFVLLMPFHDPVRVAEDCAAVDIWSNGRFDFGVGQGYRAEEFAALCIPREERSARLAEGVDLIKRLWTEDRVSFAGRFSQVEGLTLSPKPVQKPHPPIWIGAAHRESRRARRASRLPSARHRQYRSRCSLRQGAARERTRSGRLFDRSVARRLRRQERRSGVGRSR